MMGAPMQYRIPLEGGDTLVLTLEVEINEAVESAPVDPTSVGEMLLNALGIGRPAVKQASMKATRTRPAPPTEENPDTWLRRTSEQSLQTKFKRNTRADGDVAP